MQGKPTTDGFGIEAKILLTGFTLGISANEPPTRRQGFLLGIDEVAIRAKGLKGRGDGDLVGEQGDSDTLGRSP